MTTKPADTRIARELLDLNRDFLGLLLKAPSGRAAYGLDPAVLARLRALEDPQVELLARTPVLLAGFAVPPPFPVPRLVAEARPLILQPGSAYYAAGLLTWLWQTARADRLAAALAMGPGRDTITALANADFREIHRAAEMAPGLLTARFCRHPRLWADLVRAAAASDPELLRITQLSAVQLTLVGRAPGAAAAARLASLRRPPPRRLPERPDLGKLR